jgi:hypothetical protein
MRSILFALALLTAHPAAAFTTVDEYAADFAAARECRQLADGRRVWAGGEAYYVQSWFFETGQSGAIDDDAVSAIPIADNAPDALTTFANACD